jgi:hypothetical protein
MEACRCQRCGESTVVPGHLVVGEGSQIFRFAPAATHSHVKLTGKTWDEAHATIPTWFESSEPLAFLDSRSFWSFDGGDFAFNSATKRFPSSTSVSISCL